jgi:hypothetical protein
LEPVKALTELEWVRRGLSACFEMDCCQFEDAWHHVAIRIINLFEAFLGSSDSQLSQFHNLRGRRAAEALAKRFGE